LLPSLAFFFFFWMPLHKGITSSELLLKTDRILLHFVEVDPQIVLPSF